MGLDGGTILYATRDDYDLQRFRSGGNHDTRIHLSSEGGRMNTCIMVAFQPNPLQLIVVSDSTSDLLVVESHA